MGKHTVIRRRDIRSAVCFIKSDLRNFPTRSLSKMKFIVISLLIGVSTTLKVENSTSISELFELSMTEFESLEAEGGNSSHKETFMSFESLVFVVLMCVGILIPGVAILLVKKYYSKENIPYNEFSNSKNDLIL